MKVENKITGNNVSNDVNQHFKIVFNDQTPVDYWCTVLNCEKDDLIHAMSVIGNSFDIVDYFLMLNRKKKINE